MEEIPDDNNKKNGHTLPGGVHTLLMNDEEFKTLQQGEKLETKQPKLTKTHEKPDLMECQPTSSKVKTEDMTTDEKEKISEEQNNTTTSQNTRSFWDKPTHQPQHDWLHDPRMPDECNAVIASMRIYKGNHTSPKGEQYRDALQDEISEPLEFMDRQPSPLDYIRKQLSL